MSPGHLRASASPQQNGNYNYACLKHCWDDQIRKTHRQVSLAVLRIILCVFIYPEQGKEKGKLTQGRKKKQVPNALEMEALTRTCHGRWPGATLLRAVPDPPLGR